MTEDQASSSAPWTWRSSTDVALLTLLSNTLLSFFLGTLLQEVSDVFNIHTVGYPLGTAILGASEALLLIPLLLYSRKFDINPRNFSPHIENWNQSIVDIGSGTLMGLAMVPASILLSAINEMIIGKQPGAEYLQQSFTVTSPIEAILLLSVIVLVVAPSEEIISRGFIQRGLDTSFGKLKGLILASFAFSIMHLNPWSMLPLLVLGMMLGLVFQLRQNSVLAPITSHAVYMICLVAFYSL